MVARVIAIDGPAASGKSSAASHLALRLGIPYVSTGAMYRAVAWMASRRGVGTGNPVSEATLSPVLNALKMEYSRRPDGSFALCVDGAFPDSELRGGEISALASQVSALPCVREFLSGLQRAMAGSNWIVMEGRDIGTVVFPDAAVKIFLTASPLERARRRLAQEGGGDLETVAREIAERDRRDVTREISPLIAAPDAVMVDSTGLSVEETDAKIYDIVSRHSMDYRVSYGDTDQMGVVYYANYLEIFERGRTEMLRSAGITYRELEAMGAFLPVAEVNCHYRGSAVYDDLLNVRTRITGARGARLIISGEILRGDTVLVTSEITLCCTDARHKARRLPAELLAACRIYIHEVEA
ncbi:MAG: (d)CMP kinase [Victivallaceae bacterium]|nr:(d)CMP kinase [Victivallaceae bacterium]